MALRDARDLGRDRGREEGRLARGRDRGQHRIEVLGEAHVEHLVGLVEHDEFDGIEVQAAPGQVVDGSSRRGDDQVHAAPQAAQLLADRLPAVHRQHADARRPPVAMDRLGHLHRELARRHEDEPANPPVAAIVPGDPVDRRKGEGRRLARAGRRFGEDVAALEERRDRLPLDRRRLLVTQLAERGDQLTADPQREEFGISGGSGLARRDPRLGCRSCAHLVPNRPFRHG